MTESNSAFWWDLLKDEGLGLGGTLLRGTFSGLGLGLLAALAAFFLYRSLGLLPRSGGGARKLLVLSWLLLLLPTAFAFVGFHKGIARAAHRLTRSGPFAREVLPGAAAGLSDLVFLLDVRMGELLGETAEADRETLDVARFLDRKTRVEDQVLRRLLPQLAEEVKAKHPLLLEGAGANIVDAFVLRFGDVLIRGQISGQAEKLGLRSPLAAWLRDLPAAAAAEGSPDDLTRHELAAYTVRTLAESFILRPMELAIRIQKHLGYAAIGLIVLLPVPPLAWAARRERRETPVPTQGTP